VAVKYRTLRYTIWFLISVFCHVLSASLTVSFPVGYDMGTMGTIIHPGGMSGRQPWISANLHNGEKRFGLSLTGVEYYDAMDNMSDLRMLETGLGGWFALQKLLTVKAAWFYFDAFRIYNETRGYISVTTRLIPYVFPAIEFSGVSAGLTQNADRRNLAAMGVSAVFHGRFITAGFSCRNLSLYGSGDDFLPPMGGELRLHAKSNVFGSQGVRLLFDFNSNPNFRLFVGEEYRFSENIGICVAVASKPLMVSVGVVVRWSNHGATVSLVKHGVLGWSKGFSYEYVR